MDELRVLLSKPFLTNDEACRVRYLAERYNVKLAWRRVSLDFGAKWSEWRGEDGGIIRPTDSCVLVQHA